MVKIDRIALHMRTHHATHDANHQSDEAHSKEPSLNDEPTADVKDNHKIEEKVTQQQAFLPQINSRSPDQTDKKALEEFNEII